MDGEMDPTNPTPSASSTVTSSDASSTFQASHVLEISLISAQDLAQVSKSMRTYAIVWIHPNKKLTTRVDNQGHNNPTWNERFAFRVDDELLSSDQAAVMVEIYTVSWFRDVHVGTVRVLMSDLITPFARNNTRFVALQIRRSSGNPQGKLNMGVVLTDCTKRSMPICNNYHDGIDKDGDNREDEHKVFDNMPLWRSYSIGTSDISENFHGKAGSMVNGSMVYGSELCSDVGPSASIVAAEIALKSQNRPPIANRSCNKEELLDNKGNSIVMDITLEEARAKGLMTSNLARWKKEATTNHDNEEDEDEDGESEIKDQESSTRRHSRRHSDGGLISCFGSAYGFEFKIVCGKPKENKSQRKRLIASSETSSA